MNRLLGSIALAGFVISAVVHVATLANVDVSSRAPYIWLLHVGAIFAFGSLALSGRKVFRRGRAFGELRDHLPAWAVLIFVVIFGYVLVNSILTLPIAGNGNANVVGGQYVLTMHGRVVGQLTEQEYHSHRAYELRLFSGFWLIFFVLPIVYFFFWRNPVPTVRFEG